MEAQVSELTRWQALNTRAQVAVIAHSRHQFSLGKSVMFIALNTDRSRYQSSLVWQLASRIRGGAFQIVHAHGCKSAQLLAAVRPFTNCRQVITRYNLRSPPDKLASTFDARFAATPDSIAGSRLPWHLLAPDSPEHSALAVWQIYAGLPSVSPAVGSSVL